MGLTVTNVNTLSLLNILNRTTANQSATLAQLATGFKINKGADDPAGLIAVQSLSSELTGVEAAIANGQRAKSFATTADGALTEVSSLLNQIQSLAAKSTSSGALSAAEIAANQAQIDSAIDSIDRIVRTTSFNGKRLLDGQLSIRATATLPAEVTDVKVYSRPSSTANQTFAVNVTTPGTVASATLTTVASAALSAASFSITGALGTATIAVTDTDTLAQIRDKIIAAAADTGVSASLNAGQIRIQSRSYGSAAFVQASYISGDVDFNNVAYTAGNNAVVTVNGQNAAADGLRVSFNSNGTSGEFVLTAAGNVAGTAGNITISGGGATFQLGTESNTQSTIGLNPLFSQNLGDSVTGYLSTIKSGGVNSLTTNANNAVNVTRAAIMQVATAQGRIGGFQKYQVETVLNSLGATQEALESARSTIRDVDFAKATAELSRQNVLLQSGISLLGVASQQTSQILGLLR
ncbi:MAG TPA: flagellin [Phycisphaerae bacterium]|nr:flagellin [Phycisphaerae bacterium]